jgi:hypothetical protein
MNHLPIFWTESYLKLYGENVFILGVNNLGECIKCAPNEIGRFEVTHYLTCINLEHGILVPARATFGGVFPAASEKVYEMIFRDLLKFGQKLNVEIRFPPEYFHPEVFDNQRVMIESIGEKTKIIDLSYHINVEDWSSGSLSKGNQKKIRQCSRAGVVFKKDDQGSASNIYQLILKNRLSKGVTTSISQDQLERAIRFLPNEYEFFSLYKSGILIASAVTVMLTSAVRYVYMWADQVEYRSLSPIAMLCEEIIKDSKRRNIKIVDLGTASLQGELDEGLARFKQNLGAISTQKISYIYSATK